MNLTYLRKRLFLFAALVLLTILALVILLLLVTTIRIYSEQFAAEDSTLLRETLEHRLGDGQKKEPASGT